MRQRTAAHVALQIRAMRDVRGWSQDELAAASGVTQASISRCERIGYGKQNITTLLKLAEAFDVGLDVSFVTFRELWRRERRLAVQPLAPPTFSEEERLAATESKVVDIATALPVTGNRHVVAREGTRYQPKVSASTGQQIRLFADVDVREIAEVKHVRFA
jgi:transcriptional regulator with XRE-family HTH domain